ncbi:hypothetical protein CAPTEDRAFT_224129, partial [Capitella teleta]
MAENGTSEKVGLGHFAKSQTKYGATNKGSHSPRMETYVKHTLVKGETLQGIALKYNASMEQIKRANKIWTNDSLFLHEFILIPVDRSSQQQSSKNQASQHDAVLSDSDEIVTRQELSHSQSLQSSLKDSASPASPPPTPDLSASDFLNRLDSSLASIKTNIERLENSTEFPDDGSNPLHHLPIKRASRPSNRARHSLPSEQQLYDVNSEPLLTFKSRREMSSNSYQRLEQSYDGIYEL